MTKPTRIAHWATVALMAGAVLVATGDGFAQSYAGLLRWAAGHHLAGWRRDSFPLLVDLFILVGELGLFALALEGHRLTKKALAWTDLGLPGGIAVAGWTVSLIFNVGAAHHDTADRVTAAVPPVAAMLGLLVFLRTLHRLVRSHPASRAATGEPDVPEVAEDVRAMAYDGPAWWPTFIHLDRPPSKAADEAVTVVDGRPEPNARAVAQAADSGHPQPPLAGLVAASHGPVVDVPSAVRSARAAGRSKRSISKEFGISRYQVDQILDGSADEPPSTASARRVAGPGGLAETPPDDAPDAPASGPLVGHLNGHPGHPTEGS